MVKDLKTGTCYRVDKLIEEFVPKMIQKDKKMTPEDKLKFQTIADECYAFDQEQFNKAVQELKLKSPENNDVGEATPFNLMFETQIGPQGNLKGYLRPETAQGIFINFRRKRGVQLLDMCFLMVNIYSIIGTINIGSAVISVSKIHLYQIFDFMVVKFVSDAITTIYVVFQQ